MELPFFDNSFATVYADPPWPEYGGGRIKRGADRHFPLMKVSAIMDMGAEVQRIARPDSHLYLWATNNRLEDSYAVVRAWGFRPVTVITWVKDRKGLGQYFRGLTEHCVFGVRGHLPYRYASDGKRAQGETVIHSPKRRHSEKPEAMREMIETVSYGPYLELFARKVALGWSAWGLDLYAEAA